MRRDEDQRRAGMPALRISWRKRMDTLPEGRGRGVPCLLRSVPVLQPGECELRAHSMRIFREQNRELFRVEGQWRRGKHAALTA